MFDAFTIYNCGTGYNRRSQDVVGQLYSVTASPNMANDGPGGVGLLRGNPGGATMITGLLGGVGVDANVTAAFDEVKQRNKTGLTVNMCGWSRGAITCFKIANALWTDPSTRSIRVNIFAIDPVPGGTGMNNHMWRNIDVKPNVRMGQVILSQHDRRSLFAPYMPLVGTSDVDIDIMPGDHSTIVEPKPNRTEAFELVMDMAKRFLRSQGTVLGGAPLFHSSQILNRYGRLARNFDDYAQYAKGASMLKSRRFEGTRDLRDVSGRVVASMRPGRFSFFLNDHHRKTCKNDYPLITDELEKDQGIAFKDFSTSPLLKQETARMGRECFDHLEMVSIYMEKCMSPQRR